MAKATLGIIVGNRDFFPDHLVTEARADLAQLLQTLDLDAVWLREEDSKLGGVATFADAAKCAQLFRQNRERIDGILVVLPNFGDEKGVADTLKLADLRVPVLVQAYPDDLDAMHVERRRDGFCGKISVCNNLVQRGIPFSLTRNHVVPIADQRFASDLKRFVLVCRVVNRLRSARLGAIGARPGAFNTVRYSEKILEANGISVTTIDLSDILAQVQRLDSSDPAVHDQREQIRRYADARNVPADKLTQMARMGVVLARFVEENGLDATAIQCWTSVQENAGINVCTNMSMMSQSMVPSACEVDVTGVLTMYAMQLAAESPSALADWNNNYGREPDKCVLFHCGNWAKAFVPEAQISTAPILETVVGQGTTHGALDGRTPAGPLTFGRLTTDDRNGVIRAYVGEGVMTDDPLPTFGTRAVASVPRLEKLMRYICQNGFEHHVVMTQSHTAEVLVEAFQTYLGWEVYHHQRPEEAAS